VIRGRWLSPSEEACAYHEAGHYVVARQMGFDAESCCTDGRGNGLTRYSYSRHKRITSDEARRLASVLFGGMLAERMKFGDVLGDHSGDHRKANELLTVFPRCQRLRIQAEAMSAAAVALRERWELVAAIAEHIRGGGKWGTDG
jgi:hypothetical protein